MVQPEKMTVEQMAALYYNRSVGNGLSATELRALLAKIMQEGGHNPDDAELRKEIGLAFRKAAA